MDEILCTEEIKRIELNILLEIDKICRNRNIKYMLCGGTLLGAIRHQGFIPWDDDIDIFMPRPDYDEFIKYCIENKTTFELFSSEINEKYNMLFTKATDRNTVIIDHESDMKNCQHGVWVDIFPIDGLGKTKKEAIKFLKSFKLIKNIYISARWKRYYLSKKNRWYYEPFRLASFIVSRFIINISKLIKRIESKSRSKGYDSSEYCGCIYGANGFNEIMEKDIFEETIEVKFETHMFLAPKRYNDYLSNIYGDYLTLPPKDKQISNHSFTVYRKEMEI